MQNILFASISLDLTFVMDSQIKPNGNRLTSKDHISSEKRTKIFYERLSYNWAVFPVTVGISFLGTFLTTCTLKTSYAQNI